MAIENEQVGGDHYLNLGVQPWDVFGTWLTHEQQVGFYLGSAIAYLARYNAEADGKGGLTDVRKCIHNLEKLIEVVELEQFTWDQLTNDITQIG